VDEIRGSDAVTQASRIPMVRIKGRLSVALAALLLTVGSLA
jgi:hypothetical protein